MAVVVKAGRALGACSVKFVHDRSFLSRVLVTLFERLEADQAVAVKYDWVFLAEVGFELFTQGIGIR